MKCEMVTGNMPQLWEDLLSQLHEKEYPSESIRHYREAMGRVDRYMRENQILEYTEAVGETYLATHGGRISSGRQFYMSFYVRRLNDILNKRPYVVVHTRKKEKDLKHFSGVFERFDEMLCKQSISDGTRKLQDLYCYEFLRFLYKGIIIKHNKTEPTYTKTSLFLCEKRRFFMARREKGVVPIIYFEKERGKSF